jgi:hypothetical protein
VLVVGGTQVPRVESLCCKVRCDDDLKAACLNRAVSRLLSGPTAHACCELVRLHGMRNRCPTHHSGRVHVPGSHHVVRFASWSRRRVLVRTSNLSREAETCRATQRLVVRGGDWSEGVPLVGNLSEKLPTSREQVVLPVMVLTGVLSPPHLESWPSRCQFWPSHCQWS